MIRLLDEYTFNPLSDCSRGSDSGTSTGNNGSSHGESSRACGGAEARSADNAETCDSADHPQGTGACASSSHRKGASASTRSAYAHNRRTKTDLRGRFVDFPVAQVALS